MAVSGGFKPIEDIRIGDRVESTDGTHDLTEIDEKTWKHISVRMPNSEGSGDVLDIELLRSPKWIEESGCQVGASIGLAVPELGIAGWARVLAVEPCPKLQTGSGRVVTMTVTHFNSFVLQFKLEGLSEVLEPTETHPLYSEDRGEWVHAGELKTGERLRTKTGPARIEAISHREGTYRVYNFEVEETHAYYTSTSSVLSHNALAKNCGPKGSGQGTPSQAGTKPYQTVSGDELAGRRADFNSTARKDFLKQYAKTSEAKMLFSEEDLVLMREKGVLPEDYVVHHKVPLFRGGSNKFSNLDVILRDYHRANYSGLHFYEPGKNPYGCNK